MKLSYVRIHRLRRWFTNWIGYKPRRCTTVCQLCITSRSRM